MLKKIKHLITAMLFLTILLFTFTYFIAGEYFGKQVYEISLIISLVVAFITLAIIIGRLIQSQYINHALNLERELAMWNTIAYKVKKSGETAFNKLPIGILVLDNENKVLWSNEFARQAFRSQLDNMSLKNINRTLDDGILDGKVKFECQIYDDTYEIQYDKEHQLIYLTNITPMINLEKKYNERIQAIGFINIDNLEETLADFDVQERAHYMSLIIRLLAEWAEKHEVYVRAYSDHRYLLLLNQQLLKKIMKTNFPLLDSIKDVIRINTVTRLSLSIGIACEDIGGNELAELANQQLELALKRGGDQVVVRLNSKIVYFGAKTDAAPRDSKVFIRMKSSELQEHINNSSKVIIMGHRDLDADGFGASLGLYKLCQTLEKEAYMVINLDSMDSTVSRIYDAIQKEYVYLKNVIISSSSAHRMVDKDTLLIVVDCQHYGIVMDSSLCYRTNKIAVIDHHRKGVGPIENRIYEHTSTSASSSVELVVELFEFVKDEVDLDTLEATWLLLGMIVDTNHFVYRTSEVTFEVAAYLTRYGANMTGVKRYLKEDITEKLARNEFISNVEIYKERVGITIGGNDIQYERATIAKIADEIISVTGIEVGIVIAYLTDGNIGISARSLGSINVQILMEKMGGGGHLNNAATQLSSEIYTLELASQKIKEHLDEYFEKEETMKIILLKEVKGRGKKGDIIEVQPGYGNHLVRVGQAILASPENIKILDEEKHRQEIEAEQFLQEMKELKTLIESLSIEIPVRVGQEGKIFGSVSIKQVIDAFKAKTNITLDKRKINYQETINQLGTYKIGIQLHKEVNATIVVHVVEKR